ncbi:unnamed protein product [Arabis nemorensis]|uniref:Uncharacterized protein n=1 Tax=Arabis nemorensis TaxID=586526 RepID=A0A565ANT0_9BRAS|nr:unnamed protein product [Arabis nemorensis]
MDSITNWYFGSLETYHSVEPFEKFQEDEFLDISLVPLLQAELWKAQSRIKELEAEKFGSSQEKIRSKRGKKGKETKYENSRLKKKILDMKSSVKRLRRKRDTMEKVCEELVTKICELKTETNRLWDEREEERQMFHIAEMSREEKVRVKLMDANLALQEKYEEMNWFVDELEKSLEMTREVGGIEEMSLRRGKALIKTARSMEVVDNKMDFEGFEFVSDDDDK